MNHTQSVTDKKIVLVFGEIAITSKDALAKLKEAGEAFLPLGARRVYIVDAVEFEPGKTVLLQKGEVPINLISLHDARRTIRESFIDILKLVGKGTKSSKRQSHNDARRKDFERQLDRVMEAYRMESTGVEVVDELSEKMFCFNDVFHRDLKMESASTVRTVIKFVAEESYEDWSEHMMNLVDIATPDECVAFYGQIKNGEHRKILAEAMETIKTGEALAYIVKVVAKMELDLAESFVGALSFESCLRVSVQFSSDTKNQDIFNKVHERVKYKRLETPIKDKLKLVTQMFAQGEFNAACVVFADGNTGIATAAGVSAGAVLAVVATGAVLTPRVIKVLQIGEKQDMVKPKA